MPDPTSQPATLADCRATFDGRTLMVACARIERHWELVDGLLYPTSLLDRATGRQWLAGRSHCPSLCPPFPFPHRDISAPPTFTTRTGHDGPIEDESLVADLTVSQAGAIVTYRFKTFPRLGGITQQLIVVQLPPDGYPASSTQPQSNTAPTGIEPGRPPGVKANPKSPLPDAHDYLDLSPGHYDLTHVELRDQTDIHDNLVFENRWLLHPAETLIQLPGNLFALEDRLSGAGLVFLKLAPLPHARPIKTDADLVNTGASVRLFGHGLSPDTPAGYPLAILAYDHGQWGRTAAIHALQRRLRPYVPGRDGILLGNTWGDRSRDARMSESFVLKELAAAERIGADGVQLDDGWQLGRSGNSATPGGVWTGFYAANPRFWEPHPDRFPHGLKPVADAAATRHVRLGMWFSPDASSDYANWKRDADQVLSFLRTYGATHVKIDGVKIFTPLGQSNFARFVDQVLNDSLGQVTLQLDITANVRPGYFGAIQAGPIFVENRYTDWRRYFPHSTLRNLWLLTRHIDPVRLQIEFLNNTRNANLYPDDPLAPATYSPAYLFATTMFATPLAWCELSNLPPAYVAEVSPLISLWKQHRDAIYAGTTHPIGHPPDGTSWTGFLSHRPDAPSHLLVFREYNQRPTATIDLPPLAGRRYRSTLLAGTGTVDLLDGQARLHLDAPRSFLWTRLDPA